MNNELIVNGDDLFTGFGRERIKRAKKGYHYIAWAPGEAKHTVMVTKVLGAHVWVKQEGNDEVLKLNTGASILLMNEGYREP